MAMRCHPWLVPLLLLGVWTSAAAQEASIVGSVEDRSGARLIGARVDLLGDGPGLSTTTGPDGHFRIVNVPPGHYTLTVTRTGFRGASRESLRIDAGDVLTIPFVLEVQGVDEQVDVRTRRRPLPSSVSLAAEDLQSRPGARDPGGLVAGVPGAVASRLDAAGAESVSPSPFLYRGGRDTDNTWTIDGVPVTDRQTGRAPGYYDVDSLAEVQFAPATGDSRVPGTGLGVNLVVRSGGDQLRGMVRGFFTNTRLQDRPPDPRSDHTRQVHEFGADVSGPIARGRAWFMASASEREARLQRLASGYERAVATPASLKVNWQATPADRLNVLWLDHRERRYGIAPSALRPGPGAVLDQVPLHSSAPFRGLAKVEHARTIGPLSLATRYAHYSAGFEQRSREEGPAGVSHRTGETIGATLSSRSTRPQHTIAADASLFTTARGLGHAVSLGGGWQRVEMRNSARWPGDGIVAMDYTAADQRARIYRESDAHSRLVFGHVYLSDTISRDRFTIDLGVRLDHQRGEMLPTRAAGNPVFPDLVPAIDVAKSSTRRWTDLSPRASVRYALTSAGGVALRASLGRFASQQVMAVVVQSNPANVSGWIEYPWEDANGDRLAQPGEVRVDLPYRAFESINPADPASPLGTTRLDPAMSSRIASMASAGIEGDLVEHLHASIFYHYARHTDWPTVRWEGLTAADYAHVRTLSATLPDGTLAEVPIYEPDAELIRAHGSRRIFVTDPGFYTTYRGLELALTRRMSGGWALAVSGAWNDSRGFYTARPATNSVGNPTPLDGTTGAQLTSPKDPLVQGGQIAPFTPPFTSGARSFLNARWQLGATAAVRLPAAFEATATVLGREGAPSPYVMTHSLGLDGTRSVLMTPRIDTIRLASLWNVDVRITRSIRVGSIRVHVLGDLFNVLNADTALAKDRNLRSLNFDRVSMRVSPRILRLGLRLSY
jgi:hypothetical protein